MFLLHKPSRDDVNRFLGRQSETPYSYSEIGVTRDSQAPVRYTVDHNRVYLGNGRERYLRAIQAVRHWKMFDFSWVTLCHDDTPIEAGRTVGILVRHLRFWSLNAARIVYVVSETDGELERFGFAYGTLMEHAERGEERFTVEYHPNDDSVWYDLYAFSRPRHLMARLGYLASRHYQKQFAIESMKAMQRAVAG